MEVHAGPGGRGTGLDSAQEFVSGLDLTYRPPVSISTLTVDPITAEVRIPGDVSRPFTAGALQSLAKMSGLPPRYMVDAPNDTTAWNFNRALPNINGDVAFVTDDRTGVIVSSLKPGVNPLRVHDFMRLAPRDDFEIHDWTYDASGFTANWVSPRVNLSASPRIGDVVKAMVKVMLRDLEDRGPGVKGTLLRLVCTNGATAPENSKARSVFQKESWLDSKARVDTITRSATIAIADLDQVIVGLSELPQLDVELPTGWPARQDYLKAPLKIIKLGKSEIEPVASALDDEESSLFGIYNAITRVGRDALVRNKKTKFENAGFELITKREAVIAAFQKQEEESV